MSDRKVHVRKSFAVVAMILVAAVGITLGTVVTAKAAGHAGTTHAVAFAPTEPAQPLVNAASLAQGFRPVVKKALPAVVSISTTTKVATRGREQSNPFFQFFGHDFGNGFGEMPQSRPESALGSGVIVRSDGYILTNNHVVDGADEIVVTLSDKRDFKAKVVGSDAKTDLALLKVDATDLPFLPLGDHSDLEVGDIVLALGNPFGVGETVTMGIVGATGRGLGSDNPADYQDFIQTDAAINPGNSGGPLVNVAGEVVGINSAIYTRSGGNQGIGFAIPAYVAREVMNQIVEHGKVVRGYLGVMIQPVDPKVARAFNLTKASGALIGDVSPDSPAAKAGVKTGDVIVGVNDKKIADPRDLQWTIARAGPDKTVQLELIRDGQDKTLPVTLGEAPDNNEGSESSGNLSGALDGVQVDDLTPQIARQLDLPTRTEGVVVTSVEPGSPAAEAGLRRGDVIEEVNRQAVSNVRDFTSAVHQAGSKSVLLLVNSGGSTHFVPIEP